MIISKVSMEELPEILALQYLAYQSEAKLCNCSKIPPLTQTLKDLQQEFVLGVFLKAVDAQGVIVGSVRAYVEQGTLYIGKLMVKPELQGQGIGSRLLAEIEKIMPQPRYELFTSGKSLQNIKLYERLGYKYFKEQVILPELKLIYLQKFDVQ